MPDFLTKLPPEVAGATGAGTAWASVTRGTVSFNKCTASSGSMRHIVRLRNGATVFETNSMATGYATSFAVVDSGNSELIVPVV